LIGGGVAGVVFALFEMVAAAAMTGMDAVVMPLRMIGAIVLGPAALGPVVSPTTAGAAGLVLHMALSMVFGLVFGLAARWVLSPSVSSGSLVLAASLFGLGLWVVNVYLIAPAAGWRWFPDQTHPFVQFVAHTFFFGTVLGVYLDRAVERDRVAG
jgi:hypothetical protein